MFRWAGADSNIDQLAAKGVRFDNACVTASSCSPIRNSIALIVDGKFGNAIRCKPEEDDQYMMTGSSDWTADRDTFRDHGWIRLNLCDSGGFLFHVYDQVYLSDGTIDGNIQHQ